MAQPPGMAARKNVDGAQAVCAASSLESARCIHSILLRPNGILLNLATQQSAWVMHNSIVADCANEMEFAPDCEPSCCRPPPPSLLTGLDARTAHLPHRRSGPRTLPPPSGPHVRAQMLQWAKADVGSE